MDWDEIQARAQDAFGIAAMPAHVRERFAAMTDEQRGYFLAGARFCFNGMSGAAEMLRTAEGAPEELVEIISYASEAMSNGMTKIVDEIELTFPSTPYIDIDKELLR